VPASRKAAIVKDGISKFLKLFMFSSKVLVVFDFDIEVFLAYGNTALPPPENVPPVYVPAYCSTDAAPLAPAVPGNVTVTVAEPPFAAMVPRLSGTDPLTPPSVAVVRIALAAAPVPVLVTVTVAV
jgi:hypothetical protein